MKQRTFDEIMQSKQIYRKHAQRYKQMSDEQQDRLAKRMLVWTAALTKVIANCKR